MVKLWYSRNDALIARREYMTLSVVVSAMIMTLPAVSNGFPFVTWDSGTYLEAAIKLWLPYDRPIYYSIFAALCHWTLSPWPIVVVQALVVAYVVRLVAISVFEIGSHFFTLLVTLLLTFGATLPWFVGQITPDIFTSILFLAVTLVVFGWHRLREAERWFALGLIPVCVSFHNSNVIIAVGIVASISSLYLVGWRPGGFALKRSMQIVTALTLGVSALVATNLVARRSFVISPGASTFLFAKLLDDGPGFEVLEDECGTKNYSVCTQIESLQEYRSKVEKNSDAPLSDYFLWGGPLEALGWFQRFEPEAKVLVRKAIQHALWTQMKWSVQNARAQFVRVAPGDGLIPYASDVQPSIAIRQVFSTGVYSSYVTSQQNQGALDFKRINRVCFFALALAAAALLFCATVSWRTDRLALYIAIFTVMFLITNAAVTGILSSVHDRYQSRVIWIVPLMAILTVMRTLREWKTET